MQNFSPKNQQNSQAAIDEPCYSKGPLNTHERSSAFKILTSFWTWMNNVWHYSITTIFLNLFLKTDRLFRRGVSPTPGFLDLYRFYSNSLEEHLKEEVDLFWAHCATSGWTPSHWKFSQLIRSILNESCRKRIGFSWWAKKKKQPSVSMTERRTFVTCLSEPLLILKKILKIGIFQNQSSPSSPKVRPSPNGDFQALQTGSQLACFLV